MKTEILKAVQAYRRGVLTAPQFISILFQNLDETTLPVLLEFCPPELMTSLQAVVRASPATDADWANLKFVQKHSGHDLGQAEAEKGHAILRSRYRKGIETLRTHFESAGWN